MNDWTDSRQFATAPAWALVCLASGTLVAISLIPGLEFYQPGSLVWPAAALTAGLLGGIAVAAARSPLSVMRAEHILSVGLVYWLLLDLFQARDVQAVVSHDAIVLAFTSICVFAAGLWSGSFAAAVYAARRGPPAAAHAPDLDDRFLLWGAVLAAMIALSRYLLACNLSPACVIDSFNWPRFMAPWFRPDAFGPFDTVFMFAKYFGFLPLPLAAALIARDGRVTPRVLLPLVLGAACLAMMVRDGGRKDVGTVIGASLLAWLLVRPHLHVGRLAVAGAGVVGAIVLMQLMLVARYGGIGQVFSDGVELSQAQVPIGTVDRNFEYLSHVVALVPSQVPHNGWNGVIYALTSWIPNIQHVPRGLNLPYYLNLQVTQYFSWTYSVVGDLYLIAGLPAVFTGGLLFGAAAAAASQRLLSDTSTRRRLLYSLVVMTLFVSLRALHELFVTGLIVAAFWGLQTARRLVPLARTRLARAEPRLGLR